MCCAILPPGLEGMLTKQPPGPRADAAEAPLPPLFCLELRPLPLVSLPLVPALLLLLAPSLPLAWLPDQPRRSRRMREATMRLPDCTHSPAPSTLHLSMLAELASEATTAEASPAGDHKTHRVSCMRPPLRKEASAMSTALAAELPFWQLPSQPLCHRRVQFWSTARPPQEASTSAVSCVEVVSPRMSCTAHWVRRTLAPCPLTCRVGLLAVTCQQAAACTFQACAAGHAQLRQSVLKAHLSRFILWLKACN